MEFEIIGDITEIEIIAAGRGVFLRRQMNEFVICINSDSNPASLILGKVYRRLPDAEAEKHHLIRIVDEDKSEADGYLYPASLFAPIELPEVAARALMTANG